MDSLLLSFRNSQIHYLRFGQGVRKAICFHGYGESAASFDFLEKWAGHLYTFYAIDLPFHGKTEWKEGALKLEDLKKIISHLIQPPQPLNLSTMPASRQALNLQPSTLLGYSLGGRVALALYQSMPEQIEKLILFAPDGLKLNFWYWLATQTWAGNRLFSLTMKKPGWFLEFIKVLNKLKLVNASIFKFVNYYLEDEVVRDLLYKRWTGLRRIRPNLAAIKEKINRHNTPVELVYGQYDRIILSSVIEKFRKNIEAHTKINKLHAGHQVLHEKHMAALMKILQS